MFEIPHYTIKMRWLGELHPTTTEGYMRKLLKSRNIESVAIEFVEDRVIAHVEQIVAS